MELALTEESYLKHIYSFQEICDLIGQNKFSDVLVVKQDDKTSVTIPHEKSLILINKLHELKVCIYDIITKRYVGTSETVTTIPKDNSYIPECITMDDIDGEGDADVDAKTLSSALTPLSLTIPALTSVYTYSSTAVSDEPDISSIYVISTDAMVKDNIYKVGRSHNVKSRISSLNTSILEGEFKQYFEMRVSKANVVRLEKEIHTALSEYLVRSGREFFQANLSTITKTIETIIKSDVDENDVEADAKKRLIVRECIDKICSSIPTPVSMSYTDIISKIKNISKGRIMTSFAKSVWIYYITECVKTHGYYPNKLNTIFIKSEILSSRSSNLND